MSKYDKRILDRDFWNTLAVETVMRYRKAIFDPAGKGKDAKDVHGAKYKNYSPDYKEAKRTGKLPRQDSSFKDSNAPVLSGDLMKGFTVTKAHSTGFGFGTITEQGKVKSLMDKGREISTNAKPIPNEVARFIMSEIGIDTKSALDKLRKRFKKKIINVKV